ncbi:hypothetical protein [Streptomyces montanisoli]|uniref:Uncharacterized protein n=1 Tax=Streptomyces montanisoli TaxID=2798581 RepID=A0A940RX43_9ACTN|nr:hypothetical protein [Streptomyces montanisoli]MBP0460807.1 hypothetical protein [Streptomyces montanisoli]
MSRPPARRVTVLYSVSATCAVIGVLLWVRGRFSSPPRVYADYLASDAYTTSAWPVWSRSVTPDRLGLYLVVVAVGLAVVAWLFSVRRG